MKAKSAISPNSKSRVEKMTRHERSGWWVKEKRQVAFMFITVVTMMLPFQMKGFVGCVETERMGLLELKSYLSYFCIPEAPSILKSWSDDDPTSDCCFWERVICNDAIGGHIVNLSLDDIIRESDFKRDSPRSLNLSLLHSFPQLLNFSFSYNWFYNLFDLIHGYKSFQRLEKLRNLDLSIHRLNNSVLPFLRAARSLRTLNLEYNRLEGVFPPEELANMTELKVLNLELNEFSVFSVQGLINRRELEILYSSYCKIRDFEARDGLRTTKLKTLDLSYNRLSEAARLEGLENLVELEVLNLEGNQLNHTRSIQVLKDMPKLQNVVLSHNHFTNLDSLGSVLPSSLQVLDLGRNQLTLTLTGYQGVCRLANLRELDLRGNYFTRMPYCLGNLTRLRTLDLSNNQLNGDLSSFVSGLPSALEYLSLLDNNFNGSFLFKSLVNHTRLKVLKLSSKVNDPNTLKIQDLTESSWVPPFQLKMLELRNFILGNTIPRFLVHQDDLSFVDLSNNKLTGAFPTWLVQNNTRLETIIMRCNSLTTLQLPRLVHGLQFLDILSNMIQKSIPEDIGIVFPMLKCLNLSSNRFHGTIPYSMGEMKSLETLDMSSNDISGQLLKTFFSGCFSLRFLKLSNNKFQGEIFSEHANLTSLVWLYLDGNSFHGSLEKGLLNSEYLQVLDLSNNSISGTLPLWMNRMSRLWRLNMRRNQLKGPFPPHLQNSLGLEVIDISYNSFSGSIPRNLNFPSLRELSLQSNEFMGSVPDTLFKVESLLLLDLQNNKFSEMIVNNIDNISNLRVFLLRNNSFQSHIPREICRVLSGVNFLDLSHNKFKGVIPSCFRNMSFGAEGGIEIHIDSLENRISFLQNWSYASALYSTDAYAELSFQLGPQAVVDFLTKNIYAPYQGRIISYMYGLHLSSNELSGEIPVEIGDLRNLISLNLSSNYLTGPIRDSISELKSLESLDLSNNKLDGSIPPQLADLNSLGVFNVSLNNLSGEIPFKGHLGSFDEKSYIGNAHLCGLPTNISCNPMRSLEPKEAKEEEEEDGDDAIDMVWFYWTCGAVYITTILSLFSFLCIDSRWSQEWFYRVDLFIHHLQRFKGRFIGN